MWEDERIQLSNLLNDAEMVAHRANDILLIECLADHFTDGLIDLFGLIINTQTDCQLRSKLLRHLSHCEAFVRVNLSTFSAGLTVK